MKTSDSLKLKMLERNMHSKLPVASKRSNSYIDLDGGLVAQDYAQATSSPWVKYAMSPRNSSKDQLWKTSK